MTTPARPLPAPWTRAPFGLRGQELAVAVLLPLLLMARLGQDGNWDLQNYHLYNAHAWLRGRYAIDVAPAQLQSWHNPLLDLPLAWMQSVGAAGWLVSLWLTLPMMACVLCLLRLAPCIGVDLRATGRWALAIVALTGASAFSALGSSFNDAFVAAGMLSALLLMLPREGRPFSWRRVLCAGFIGGATAGLKLTAAPYCVGLAAAAFVAWPRPHRLPALAALSAGGIAGVVLTYGYWGMALWHWHRNPVFPYFNQVFQSPDAPAQAFADLRFRASGWLDVVAVPFRLLVDTQRYSEPTLRDPRLFAGLLGIVLWAANRATPATSSHVRSARALVAFAVVSFLLWARQSGIYRYALPLEMLASLALIAWIARDAGRARVALTWAMVLVLVADTNHANWGRGPFHSPYVSVTLPPLPPRLLIATGSYLPVAYVATALPDDVPLVSFYNNFMEPDRCSALQAHAERLFREHVGPIWLLRGDDPSADEGQRLARERYGLEASGDCLPVTTSLGELRLCPLRRQPRPPVCVTARPPPGR